VTIHPNGSIKARGTSFNVRYPLRGQDVYVIYEPTGLMVFDDRGTLIIEHLWPPPGSSTSATASPEDPSPGQCHRCPETSQEQGCVRV